MTDQQVSETRMARAPKRIEVATMPKTPRGVAALATECGWDVSAWEGAVEVAPELYVGSGNGHDAGDVKYPGYTARSLMVEAKSPKLPLGFQAQFVGKVGAPTPLNYARIADPVGLRFPLRGIYRPVKQQRGKQEIAAAFNRRVAAALLVSQEQDRDYNDGAFIYLNDRMFYTTTPFLAWIQEWRDIIQPTMKKAL